MKRIITAALLGGSIAALSACSPMIETAYHGAVASSTLTTTAPAPVAYPVTISGSDEEVKTADLVSTGYTVSYQASSFAMIVQPVMADGSPGMSVVNALGSDFNAGVTGTAIYRATGPTTFHVFNTHGPWTLTFTPLS
jgi:hypothetical protein